MNYKEKYNKWLSSEIIDEGTKNELRNVKDEKEIEDRFYKDLEFGTGGLRGVIGAGSNRMNVYTVGKATQGFANFLVKKYGTKASIAIAFDSRIMSKEFSETVAKVMAANGVKAYLFETLRPTPMLSFTVRHLKCSGGIVVTASHNPKEYNGYKVYGDDGGQVTDTNADLILNCIEKIQDFSEVCTMDLEEAKAKKLVQMIGEDIDKVYIEKVKNLIVRKELVSQKAADLKIIYTPLNGAGNIPVRRTLKELGYSNLSVVKEQENPNGKFPTTPYPNPEVPSVFKLALDMADSIQPDLIFGTDPDCDRIGVVVKDNKGEYKVLTGNQTGILLTNYLITSLKERNELPKNAAIIKTIVTTELVRKIAENYNAELVDVLTGFKYIGEKIKEFEENNNNTFILGFEESYGYLSGTFVRDKDAVIAATLICEMALFYKSKGMSLYDGLMELFKQYGYYKESLVSMEFKGKEGQEKITKALDFMRNSMSDKVNNVQIIKKFDYKTSLEMDVLKGEEVKINLPKSNVLKFVLADGSWFVVRPSGTEPKMKVYLSIIGRSLEDAEEKTVNFKENIMTIINKACE